MKKLIARVFTKGKTEKQIVADVVAQLVANGYFVEKKDATADDRFEFCEPIKYGPFENTFPWDWE